MVEVLPEDQPVYAINMRKFYEDRKNFTIRQLAEFYLRTIRQHQVRGPYYFCGYSFGAFVAYEMATMLTSQGDEIGLLALLDAPNPAFESNLSAAELVQFRATYLFDRIRKYTRNLFLGNISKFMNEALAFLISHSGEGTWLLLRSALRTLHLSIPEILHNSDPIVRAACRAYTPSPWAKRLVLFRSQERGPEFDRDLTMGWSAFVSGGVDVHIIPGAHVHMMNKTNLQKWIGKLIAYLDNGTGREMKGPTLPVGSLGRDE
jgi:thioesterase domain-containing protein